MELIIESGATKTDFHVIGIPGGVCFRSSGINFATMDPDVAALILRDALRHLSYQAEESGITPCEFASSVTAVHFYGAGILDCCSRLSPDSRLLPVDEVLRESFPSAEMEYCSDLMAAARALSGDRPCIVLILGTGSNSCLYDGHSIVENIRPCGYVLGDFGSGAALGKMFVADYLQGLMPKWLETDFRMKYALDYASAVKEIYRDKSPARYLASFAPYVLSVAYSGSGEHDDISADGESIEYARSLIKENFRTFLRRCVVRYGGFDAGVTGSFGSAAKDLLVETAAEEGVNIVSFVASPMCGLVKYHSGRA